MKFQQQSLICCFGGEGRPEEVTIKWALLCGSGAFRHNLKIEMCVLHSASIAQLGQLKSFFMTRVKYGRPGAAATCECSSKKKVEFYTSNTLLWYLLRIFPKILYIYTVDIYVYIHISIYIDIYIYTYIYIYMFFFLTKSQLQTSASSFLT